MPRTQFCSRAICDYDKDAVLRQTLHLASSIQLANKMAASKPIIEADPVVDVGLRTIGLTVPFYDLSGASRSNPKSIHIDTDALLETAGVAHPNALQIQSIDVKGVSVGTSVGFRYV